MIFDHAKATQLAAAVKGRLEYHGLTLGDEACLDLAMAVLNAAEVPIITPAGIEEAREFHRLWKAREKLWKSLPVKHGVQCAGLTQAGYPCQNTHCRTIAGRLYCHAHWYEAADGLVDPEEQVRAPRAT